METTARAYLGAGLIKLNMWNPAKQAYEGFGDEVDSDKFEIKPNFEEKTSESRSHKDYGQARASVILPKPTEMTIELAAAGIEALAMQFQGMVQALTQSGGTQPAGDFLVSKVGRWLPLGKRNISATGFTVTNSAGDVTYDLDTHYQVNWLRGDIKFMDAAGAPDAADTVKVAFTYGAVDGKRILGGRVTQVRCQVQFDGVNMVDQAPMEADVHECVLGSNNGFDFLSQDYSGVVLSGKIVTPPGKTEGYEVRFPGVSV